MSDRQSHSAEGQVLPATTTLSQRDIELVPSQALVHAALEVALEDDAYRRYSNLPADAESDAIAENRERTVNHGEAAYWAILPPSRQIAGIFELWFRDRRAGVLEAGYWIVEPHRRQGYATVALRLVTNWVDRETGARRIELAIHPDNFPSLQLAQTAGYFHVGPCTPSAPGAPRDDFYELYAWERSG